MFEVNDKKKPWRLSLLPIGIVVLLIGFSIYLDITDPLHYDECPTKSVKNMVMLYNNGCCFVLEDLIIWLTDENEERRPLLEHAAPPYCKRLNADIPQDISGAGQVKISFRYEYGASGHTEFAIMDFESVEALKNQGLLLIFGDGTLKVKSGRRVNRFTYDKAPWAYETQFPQTVEPEALTWREAYAALLCDYTERSERAFFLLPDIDKDGAPELIVVGEYSDEYGSGDIDFTYTFKNGDVISLEYTDDVSIFDYALAARADMTVMPGNEPGLQTSLIGPSAGAFGTDAWYQIIVMDGNKLVIDIRGMRYVDVEALHELFDDFGRSIDDYAALDAAIEEHTHYYINDIAASEEELYSIFHEGEELMLHSLTEENVHKVISGLP